MKYVYIAIFVLGAFVAIWIFFVVPAERRHHERKMELVRKKIERRAQQSTIVDGTESDSKDGESS
jgi:predicted MFS family arabinose efflux permease